MNDEKPLPPGYREVAKKVFVGPLRRHVPDHYSGIRIVYGENHDTTVFGELELPGPLPLQKWEEEVFPNAVREEVVRWEVCSVTISSLESLHMDANLADALEEGWEPCGLSCSEGERYTILLRQKVRS